MAKCEFCDKGVTFGIQVSHSHRRSNRAWKPNVKRVKAIVNGSPAMFMFVPGVCVPVRSPERSKCTDKLPDKCPGVFLFPRGTHRQPL